MRVNKIVSLSVVILLISVVFAGAVTVPAAAQTDTMQFRYNAQHTGDYSPVAGTVPSNGKLKWSYTTGSAVISSPAVANGVVYVGSQDGNIYALNATTGAKLWNYTTGGSSSSPAVANGVVYVGSARSNVDALNATTGKLKWNRTIGGFVLSSPAVANGVVYVGSYDHNVYALNAITGAKLWYYTTGKGVASSPAVVKGVVYVGSDDGNIHALNANNGTKLWSSGDIGSAVSASPAVANGVVYMAGGGAFIAIAFNATTGTELWALEALTTGNYYSSPAVANGVVYVGSADNNVYAINTTSGSWNYTTGGLVSSSPAVANGVVYVGSNDGKIYAIGNQTTATRTTLSVSKTTARVGEQVTFTAQLTRSDTNAPLVGKQVTIWNVAAGLSYYMFSNKTNSSGEITWKDTYGAPPRSVTYYASFGGDSQFAKSKSANVTVTVKYGTALNLTATPTTVKVNQTFILSGRLTVNTTTNHTGIGDQTVTVLICNATSKTYNITPATTKTNDTAGALGAYSFSRRPMKAGTYYFEVYYAGTATYMAKTSAPVKVVVT